MRSTMSIRVFSVFVALILFSSSFLQVARCQSDPETEVVEGSREAGDLGIVGDDVQDFGSDSFSPAPGIETVCVFPKNPSKVVAAGEESELLVGMKNDGDSSVNIIAIQASVHLPFDHRYLVQNLSVQAFNNATVPPSAQATFPYIFAVSKFMQPGSFDLVGTIVYEIDQNPFQSTFYNGTIEVTEPGGLLSVESVFLFCLGIALIGLLGFWIRGQIQNLSKKTKRAPKAKVEVGTATTDASTDEWLEVVGIGECADCKDRNIKTIHAFSGLHVTVNCKDGNGAIKRRGEGKLDKDGKFAVSVPKEMVKDGKLKEDCYAQLHSASAAPCPTHNGIESSKIVVTNEKHTLKPVENLKFSTALCTSAFLWPHFTFPPFKFPPIPILHKPHELPPVPIYKHPDLPPVPVYKPPDVPPVPVYKPPDVPPVPVYKKPLLPHIPLYKPIPPLLKKTFPAIPLFPPSLSHP